MLQRTVLCMYDTMMDLMVKVQNFVMNVMYTLMHLLCMVAVRHWLHLDDKISIFSVYI